MDETTRPIDILGTVWSDQMISASAFRNFLLSLAIIGTSAAIAVISISVQEIKSIISILSDLWVLQGVVVTAIVTLIYRMQSDIAGLAGLNAYQRTRLDEIVRIKSRRLWIQFFFIALAAALPRVIQALDSEIGQKVAIFFTICIFSASLLYAIYIPSMWNELRTFIAERIAEREEEEERKAEEERIRDAASKAKVDPLAERIEFLRARLEELGREQTNDSRIGTLKTMLEEGLSQSDVASTFGLGNDEQGKRKA